MAEREGLSLSITTKSNLVVRDIDLLQRISERSIDHNSHDGDDGAHAARADAGAARAAPDLRLEAIRKLREAGIAVGVNAMPVLPGLTDREEDLEALVRAARDSGAQWLAASVLFLMPSSWRTFMGFSTRNSRSFAAQYRDFYGLR